MSLDPVFDEFSEVKERAVAALNERCHRFENIHSPMFFSQTLELAGHVLGIPDLQIARTAGRRSRAVWQWKMQTKRATRPEIGLILSFISHQTGREIPLTMYAELRADNRDYGNFPASALDFEPKAEEE